MIDARMPDTGKNGLDRRMMDDYTLHLVNRNRLNKNDSFGTVKIQRSSGFWRYWMLIVTVMEKIAK